MRIIRSRRLPTHDPAPRSRRRRLARHALIAAGVVLVVAGAPQAAQAADPTVVLAADSIQAVIDNIRIWLIGILAAAATLFATVGGLRLLAANGDPGEEEKGKRALRSAAIGYGLALLSPLLVTIVASWVA